MAKRTPKLDLTVPDVNDYIAAWPEIAEQGFLDLENSLIIDYHEATDPYDSYPIGMSMFGILSSNDDEGDWPPGSGMVMSWRRPAAGGDMTFQFKVSLGIEKAPNVWARTGGTSTAPGWSPWGIVTSREQAVATGSVRFDDVDPGTMVAATVALPDVFTSAPSIALTIQSYSPAAFMTSVASPSAASFEIRANHIREGEDPASVVVLWQAIQAGV